MKEHNIPIFSKYHIDKKCREIGTRACTKLIKPGELIIFVHTSNKGFAEFSQWIKDIKPVGTTASVANVSLLRLQAELFLEHIKNSTEAFQLKVEYRSLR